MFLKDKYGPDGKLTIVKARLVAGGHRQDKTLYDDIYSPTVSMFAVFYIAAVAAKEHRHVATADITGAYLNAHMKSKNRVFMILGVVETAIMCEIDPSLNQYVRQDGKMMLKVKRALYGCIESAKLWHEEMSSALQQMGFASNAVDRCVFNMRNQDGIQITVVLYVDDLMITCVSKVEIDNVLNLLKRRFKSVKHQYGPIVPYLGMSFDFSKEGKVNITMPGYIQESINKFGVSNLQTSDCPASESLFQVRDTTLLDAAEKGKFHSMVARLLYLAKRVRPDILLPVNFLATRVLKPDIDDFKKLSKVIQYLKGTKDLGLTLEPGAADCACTYVDASYATHSDYRSHTGMCMMIGKGCILAKSSKQKINSKSSTEAEFIALSDSATDSVFARQFAKFQGIEPSPAVIFQDNESAINLAKKGFLSAHRSKHISIKYFWITDRVKINHIVIKYISTNHMAADVLTKPLTGDKFKFMRNLLLNCDGIP
jgi:hypothetical protein